MTLTMEFNGTGLKINGESVATTGSTYTGPFNLASQVLEVEVLYGTNKSSMHYISAYTPGTLNATVNVDYSRATYFGTLTGPTTTYTYPGMQHCPYLDTVTQDQIDYMKECLEVMDMYFATEASKTAVYTSLTDGCTASGILDKICLDRNELTVTYDTEGTYVTHVGSSVRTAPPLDLLWYFPQFRRLDVQGRSRWCRDAAHDRRYRIPADARRCCDLVLQC